MESVNFFKAQMEAKDNGSLKAKAKAVRIGGTIFEKIAQIAEKSGMNATSICNMVLADFANKVLSDKPKWTAETKKYHNPDFDLDDDVVDFEGVI
jgi:hypothetical protein